MSYTHCFQKGVSAELPVGKVVCVGRNYADHIKELNNEVPTEPLLFLKPSTAVVSMEEPIKLLEGLGSVHFETELAILIGKRLQSAEETEVTAAIAGVGLALDLTLRDLQDKLKSKGQPWEKSKAFDGACPTSPFVPWNDQIELQNLDIQLLVNGETRQHGNTSMMLHTVTSLISYISRYFTLEPGDMVITGTPAGVGPLLSGDELVVSMSDLLEVHTVAV